MKYPKYAFLFASTFLLLNGCSSAEEKKDVAPATAPTNPPSITKIQGEGIPVLTTEQYATETEKTIAKTAKVAAEIATFGVAGYTEGPDDKYKYPVVLFECGGNVVEHPLDAPRPLAFYEGEILVHYVAIKSSRHDFDAREKLTANEKGAYALISKKEGYEAQSGVLTIEDKKFKIEEDHTYALVFPKCKKIPATVN